MSTRLRIVLSFVAVVAAALALCVSLAHVYLRITALGDVDAALADAARAVRANILALSNPQAAIENGLIALPPPSLSASGIYLQVVRGNGSICARSHHLGSDRLPVDVELLTLTLPQHAALQTLTLEDGGRLRLYNLPIVVSDRLIGAVQAGYPLRDVERVLDSATAALLVGGVLGLVAASAAAWGLSWVALRPIERLREDVARIAGTRDLAQRLAEPVAIDSVSRLATTINALLDRLEQVINAQQRLGADVSHELRTPLTTIRGNVDLLRRGAADDLHERAIALDAIEAEVNRMSRLVADLLLAAQADAGMKLERQPVEMDTLLLQVYRQAQTMATVSSASPRARGTAAGSERVTVRLGHEDQAVVMGDPDRLRQLLLNLVDNALKYTPRDGTVTLSLYRADGWVRITVEDSGTGIDPDVLPHIFERFYRGPQLGRKGVGLGLAIARWIAEAHDGRLEVASAAGRGSTFSLWLPEVEINAL